MWERPTCLDLIHSLILVGLLSRMLPTVKLRSWTANSCNNTIKKIDLPLGCQNHPTPRRSTVVGALAFLWHKILQGGIQHHASWGFILGFTWWNLAIGIFSVVIRFCMVVCCLDRQKSYWGGGGYQSTTSWLGSRIKVRAIFENAFLPTTFLLH